MAELLGELDALTKRIEELPESLLVAEKRLVTSVDRLDAAGEGYRQAVARYTEEAQRVLSVQVETSVKAVHDALNAQSQSPRKSQRSSANESAAALITHALVGAGSAALTFIVCRFF